MRFLKFLSAGLFVFTSFAALIYLLWVIDEKNEDILAQNERIRRDSINLVAKDHEIEKLSLAVNSLKGAYENIQKAFHSLSDRFSVLEQNNDSLKTRIEHLTVSVNRLNKEKKLLKNQVKKQSNYKYENQNISSQDIAGVVADLNKRKVNQSHHFRTLTDQEKEENKLALLAADNFVVNEDNGYIDLTNLNAKKLIFKFDILENEYARKEKKELIIQIIKPDGTIFNNSKEGGFFKVGGVPQPYTTKIPIFYSNSKEEVSFSFKTEKAIQNGKYQVAVYESGKEIGRKPFVLGNNTSSIN